MNEFSGLYKLTKRITWTKRDPARLRSPALETRLASVLSVPPLLAVKNLEGRNGNEAIRRGEEGSHACA